MGLQEDEYANKTFSVRPACAQRYEHARNDYECEARM